MESEANLDLDLDTKEGGARVKVSSVWAFTRHDGAPIITRACASYTEFDREISRLESELEDIRGRAAKARVVETPFYRRKKEVNA